MHRSPPLTIEQREKQSPAESSMSTLFESHHVFSSNVFQMHRNRTFRSTVDVIPIRFRRYDAYANYNPETHRYDDEFPILKRIRTLKLKFSREKASGDAKTRMERFARYKRIIAGSPREANKLRNKLGRYLSTVMSLPEDKHSFAIVQIMDMLQAADLDKIIEVSLVDVIFRDTEESLHLDLDELYYRAKLIPATESFIQALEEVSPPDDELECAICMELFAQKNHSSITQLPCSHYYHRDCIVPWLHINHVCPTCRRPNAPSRERS